jgi:hypothetical protein
MACKGKFAWLLVVGWVLAVIAVIGVQIHSAQGQCPGNKGCTMRCQNVTCVGDSDMAIGCSAYDPAQGTNGIFCDQFPIGGISCLWLVNGTTFYANAGPCKGNCTRGEQQANQTAMFCNTTGTGVIVDQNKCVPGHICIASPTK